MNQISIVDKINLMYLDIILPIHKKMLMKKGQNTNKITFEYLSDLDLVLKKVLSGDHLIS